jgi:hypothetical protein
MTEVHKLTEQNYFNLLDMINSTDAENHTIAKALISNLDVKENLVYLILLYKELPSGNTRKQFFDEKVIEDLKLYFEVDLGYTHVDWDNIINYFSAPNQDPLHLGFCLSRFSHDLTSRLNDAGFAFINNYKINLVPKHG